MAGVLIRFFVGTNGERIGHRGKTPPSPLGSGPRSAAGNWRGTIEGRLRL